MKSGSHVFPTQVVRIVTGTYIVTEKLKEKEYCSTRVCVCVCELNGLRTLENAMFEDRIVNGT